MISEHQRKQLMIVGGAGALVVGFLVLRGRSQGGVGLAPLPPVSGGYINTDNGSSAPLSQPVANVCPGGYLPIAGGSCEVGFSIPNWGGFNGAPTLSIYGGTPAAPGGPVTSAGKVRIISGGSTGIPSCLGGKC